MQYNVGPLITPDGNPIVVSAPTADITMLGITNFPIVTMFGYDFTHDGVSDQAYLLQLHVSGGGWITSNYFRNGSGNASLTTGWSIGGDAVVAAATQTGWLVILNNFNLPVPTDADISGGRKNSSTNATSAPGYLTASDVYDGFRILMSGGANITAGTLLPQGIRG